jgi:hypothetical protein
MQRLFEGGFAASGTLIVGFLAEEVFGYLPRTGAIADLPDSVRVNNIDALSNSIFWVLFVGWTLCFLIYTLNLRTYPIDKQRIRDVMQSRAMKRKESS